MPKIIIRRIDTTNAVDAKLPNESFQIWGRLIPSLENGRWTYKTEELRQSTEMCFPDEDYDIASDDGLFLGAYDGDTCVGLAVLRRDMFKYLYLDDLKVNRSLRGNGIGGMLIEACMKEARTLGLRGVYTIGQDNNLSACLFYLKHGFEIGGFDNRCYRGTSQEGNANVIFYRDLP
ncbi:MAG: GNAT family N-acetyltransferase [Clostridia bacterium]|nr:GNAT family N-acetyltransferase [Clostridia bacterium]